MKIFYGIAQEAKNALYELSVRMSPIQKSVEHDIPHVCQFATPESAELSLTGKLRAIDDPHWAETGASSPKQYAEWAFTMCGMASVLMALKHFKNDPALKIAQLAEDALENNVYVQLPSEISSMKYKEFAEWIKKYHLKASVYTRLSIKGIQRALSQGKLAIISVNPNIRGYNTAPLEQKGGHLVLVTGYNLDSGTIMINNPSGFVGSHTQVNHSLPVKDFLNYYAGRGIVISSK